jgi:predicted nucleotidyltransferase
MTKYIINIKKLIENIRGVEYHNELTSNLWKDDKIRKEVRSKLLNIADLFFDFLEIDWVDIKDIVITGSSANYNYTRYSDIDLHLIIDYKTVHKDCPLVSEYFNTKKTLFNKNHDITIKGRPVELYVEDISSPAKSTGVYSLIKNDWVKKPEYRPVQINDISIKSKLRYYKDLIDEILKDGHDLESIENFIEKIYNMRKSGLEKSGEFSVENIVFKLLRNGGYLDSLKDYVRNKYDYGLSLK